MILHGYWRSGASYRVRIALNLKGLALDNAAHDLRKGEQKAADYVALNPQGMVPALQDGDLILTQSPAILEWLEETHPAPALLPKGANDRATVRAMAALIGCDIHPLNNLRVLKAIRSEFNADQAAVDAWAAGWIAPGFDALEALVARHGAGWSFGDAPTLVDCYLIPQMYSARRFNMDLSPWPRLLAVEQTALAHRAFASAHPDVQPDADA
ncbi:maleylacetoacetate isomerase [Brevundimonas sp. WCHBH090558]|uniref:maleylacetoacetate isomerase n=1 Tax=Brevundimonas huaxiensis TaxID=2725493 RepID=UPI0016273799|nr:maleylacetoacetate isomerase [Brevundimonas huaxiensis]MBC1183464.1 maleylacetoacetate isomerase [Brevundimonas huaxiensis]